MKARIRIRMLEAIFALLHIWTEENSFMLQKEVESYYAHAEWKQIKLHEDRLMESRREISSIRPNHNSRKQHASPNRAAPPKLVGDAIGARGTVTNNGQNLDQDNQLGKSFQPPQC